MQNHIRRDEISGVTVIYAISRRDRPRTRRNTDYCPFCPGFEQDTPPNIRVRFKNGRVPSNHEVPAYTDDWCIRIMANKYPALNIRQPVQQFSVSLQDLAFSSDHGAHEVIVHTPDHQSNFTRLPAQHRHWLIEHFRERVADLYTDPSLEYCFWFHNHGEAAGMSLVHPHSQLIAMSDTPERARLEFNQALHWYHRWHNKCYYCEEINRMIRPGVETEIIFKVKGVPIQTFEQGDLKVYENNNFLVFCPPAGREYEMIIMPFEHNCSFASLSDDAIIDLADAINISLLKLQKCIRANGKKFCYNWWIRTTPHHDEGLQRAYHWYMRILPVFGTPGGLEKGAGIYISTILPRDSARMLREAKV